MSTTDRELTPDEESDAISVAIETTEDVSPTRGMTGDKLVAERWKRDDPLKTPQVVPSDAPDPTHAQRDFRGWIVIAIVVLIMIGAVLAFTLVAMVQNRRVIYAPQAQRLDAAASSREPTENEVQANLSLLVVQLESWTPATVSDVWRRVLPYLDPSQHDAMKEQYQKLSQQASYLWLHRSVIPLGVAPAAKSADGVRTYAVFYEQIEMTGNEEKDRKVTAYVEKAAFIRLVLDTPTSENPIGIKVLSYKPYDRPSWERAGFPAFWDELRKPKAGP
jgi:hypothetical protein